MFLVKRKIWKFNYKKTHANLHVGGLMKGVKLLGLEEVDMNIINRQTSNFLNYCTPFQMKGKLVGR